MSYESQANLRTDDLFTQRLTSALNEQAGVYRNDARPTWVQLAEAQLTGGGPMGTWVSVISSAPGIKDQEDPAAVTDADLLSAVQGNWGVVADLTYLNV